MLVEFKVDLFGVNVITSKTCASAHSTQSTLVCCVYLYPIQSKMNFQSHQLISLILLLSILLTAIHATTSSDGGRHSYSLTTFDPSGNLDQVVRAIRASTLGVPIVAVCLSGDSSKEYDENESSSQATIESNELPSCGGIYLSIPLRFLSTSPLLVDDGTPRIVPLTPNLCLVHTGVGADGRAISQIATNLVLDYKYLYGQDMGVSDLLAGLSSKMQEMTMKSGCRPYGCALLVCSVEENGRNAMYRVDPSGAVVLLSSNGARENMLTKNVERRRSVAFMGNWESLKQKKDLIQQQLETQSMENEEQIEKMLVDAARQTFIDDSMDENSFSERCPVLFASFSRQRGLDIKRIQ